MRTFKKYILELERPIEEGAYSRIMGTLAAGAALAGVGAGVSASMGPYDDPRAKSAYVRQAEPQDSSFISKHKTPAIKSNIHKKKVNPIPPKETPTLKPPVGFKQKIKASQQIELGSIEKAKEIIKKFEGFYENPYWDVNSYSIGYGFKKYDIPGGKVPKSMNRSQADAILTNALQTKYGNTVKKHVRVPLNDNQQAALISFVYNIGPSAFKNSSILKKLNQADYQGAADSLLQYDKVKGETWAGLSKRRQAERQLFLASGKV